MGTTLDALNADAGVRFFYVLVIEGCGTIYTDGATSWAVDAVTGGAPNGIDDGQATVCGLYVRHDMRQTIKPWDPFTEPPMLRVTITPGVDNTGAINDDLAVQMAKKYGGATTHLNADVTPASTTITGTSTGTFTGTGFVNIGCEQIEYATNAANVFGTLTRGHGSPFQTESGARFARTHKNVDVSTITGNTIGVKIKPLITAEPREWIGKWCGLWQVRVIDANLGTVDSINESNLCFAGTIADHGQDSDGNVTIAIEDVRRRIQESMIFRDQFIATVKEGVRLAAGMVFYMDADRSGIGNIAPVALTVVSGAPANASEITEGVYTASEIGNKLTAAATYHFNATTLIFKVLVRGVASTPDGMRSTIDVEDPTAGIPGTIDNRFALYFPNESVARFCGWDSATLDVQHTTRTIKITSPLVPLRHVIPSLAWTSALRQITIDVVDARGTFVDQSDIMPNALRDPAGLVEGVVMLGQGYYLARAASATQLVLTSVGGQGSEYALRGSPEIITVEDELTLPIRQVLIIEQTLSSLLRKILFSTGATGFNCTYDTLPESLACAKPYTIMGAQFVTDLANVEGSLSTLVMVIDKPTRFVDLFVGDFLLRWMFFIWKQGRLTLGVWKTPASADGPDDTTLALTEASKGVPVDSAGDLQRSIKIEDVESIRNVIKIEYGLSAGGAEPDVLILEDDASIRNHGARPITIKARNMSNRGVAGGDTLATLAHFSAGLSLFSRPMIRIRRTVGRQYFERTAPGTSVFLTDRGIRSPETGLHYDVRTGSGGLVAHPGLVVGSRYSWGGPLPGGRLEDAGGELDIMIPTRALLDAPYAPCAQIDDTASAGGFTNGYNAGTKTIRCYQSEYGPRAAPLLPDAKHFDDLDEVTIVEIDPSNPAAPLTWNDVVTGIPSTTDIVLITGLAGFDTTKKYRVVSRAYSAAVASQKTHSYQADDADMLVQDLRTAYAMTMQGSSQATSFDLAASTEPAERYVAIAYGDGAPYDTGYERLIARNLNNLIDYKTAPQVPQVYGEARLFTGTGTWQLVEILPVWVGMGALPNGWTVNLYVAPFFKSTDGTATEVRFTLGRFWNQDADNNDVTHIAPYVQQTFSTSSLTYTIPTATTLDTRHLMRSDVAFGGVGWLHVEIKSKCSYLGIGHRRIGPRVVA